MTRPEDKRDPQPAERSLSQRVTRGGRAVVLGSGARSLLELAATLVLARLVTPAEFGLVGMVVALTGFIDMFKDMGLATVTVQREHITDAQVSALFWLNLALGALLTLVTAALAPVVSWGYGYASLTEITLALSLSMLFGSVSIQHQALLRRQLKFERIAVIETSAALASAVLAVAAALAGLGVWALVVRQLARPLATGVASWLSLRWWPGWPARAPVRELLAMGGHLTGFQVVNYAERNADDVLIGKFAGAFELGCYTRAYELLRVPLQEVGSPAVTIALPALSRLTSEPRRYREAYLRMVGPVLLLTIPLCSFLVMCADWVIELAFGSQWTRAVPMFRWLGLALLVKPAAFTTSWLFVSQGRTRELWRWGVLGTVLAIAAYLVGLPWGAVGVAASYALVDLFVRVPILLYWVGRAGPVGTRDIVRACVPTWVAAGLVALGLVGLRRVVPVGLSAWVGVSLGALVTVFITLAVMTIFPSGRRTLKDLRDLASRRTPADGS